MDAVKAWARGIFVLSVLSSATLLIVPRKAQKQTRFVLSMLLLLCTVAPLVKVVPALKDGENVFSSPEEGEFHIRGFLEEETAQTVRLVASKAGYEVLSVKVGVKGLSVKRLEMDIKGPLDEGEKEDLEELLSAYLGIEDVFVHVS